MVDTRKIFRWSGLHDEAWRAWVMDHGGIEPGFWVRGLGVESWKYPYKRGMGDVFWDSGQRAEFGFRDQRKERRANMKFSTTLAFAATASAHTIFLSVNSGAVGDGVRVPTYDGVRPPFPSPFLPSIRPPPSPYPILTPSLFSPSTT
jgi:hypothetical protein